MAGTTTRTTKVLQGNGSGSWCEGNMIRQRGLDDDAPPLSAWIQHSNLTRKPLAGVLLQMLGATESFLEPALLVSAATDLLLLDGVQPPQSKSLPHAGQAGTKCRKGRCEQARSACYSEELWRARNQNELHLLTGVFSVVQTLGVFAFAIITSSKLEARVGCEKQTGGAARERHQHEGQDGNGKGQDGNGKG